MSKFLFDMIPKYTQFQPFISSQISSSSVGSSLFGSNNLSHTVAINNNNSSSNNNNSISGNSANNNLANGNSSNNNNNSSILTTSTSEGSPLTGSEGSPNSPPITNSKMYPYVSNHPSSHSSLSGMPGFSSLEDKSCR